jgi:hypothetical protein
MFRALLVTALLATASLAQTSTRSALGSGSVQGIVIDADGRPVAGASVFIKMMSVQEGTAPIGGRIPLEGLTVKADVDGSFIFNNFPIAYDVRLDAYKENSGYPMGSGSFYSYLRTKTSPRIFDVAAGQKVRGVVVQFAGRAAYLQFDVSDQDGRPLNADAKFLLPERDFSRPNRPFDMSTSISAKETTPVPSAPFWLEVDAPGYGPWRYAGERWEGRGPDHSKTGRNLGAGSPPKKASMTTHTLTTYMFMSGALGARDHGQERGRRDHTELARRLGQGTSEAARVPACALRDSAIP